MKRTLTLGLFLFIFILLSGKVWAVTTDELNTAQLNKAHIQVPVETQVHKESELPLPGETIDKVEKSRKTIGSWTVKVFEGILAFTPQSFEQRFAYYRTNFSDAAWLMWSKEMAEETNILGIAIREESSVRMIAQSEPQTLFIGAQTSPAGLLWRVQFPATLMWERGAHYRAETYIIWADVLLPRGEKSALIQALGFKK